MEPGEGAKVVEAIVQAYGNSLVAFFQLSQKEAQYLGGTGGPTMRPSATDAGTEQHALVDCEQTIAGARLAVPQVKYHSAQRLAAALNQQQAVVLSQRVYEGRVAEHRPMGRFLCEAIPAVLGCTLDEIQTHVRLFP